MLPTTPQKIIQTMTPQKMPGVSTRRAPLVYGFNPMVFVWSAGDGDAPPTGVSVRGLPDHFFTQIGSPVL